MWSKTHGDFFDLVGTFDPRLIPTAAKKGTYFRYVPPVGNPTTLIKADEGLTTNWIEASGGAASDWLLTGNFGPNLILGTLTPDRWNFVADALPRGGFEDDGRFFLKTHQFFPNSESYQHTNGVVTFDDLPLPMFTINVPDEHVGFVDVFIVARETTGVERAVFKRQAMFWREGGGAVVSTKVHTMFTDKTNDNYDVQIVASGNDVIVQVLGDLAQTVVWTGTINHQLAGEP